MATWEEELKQVEEDLELLNAELEANEEELQKHPELSRRKHFLHLRNRHIKKALVKLQERQASAKHNIEWDKRT